jgi:uncharacterized protein with PIN domain
MTPTFLVDGMLGSLNRWLRICGYETEFSGDAPDEELLDRLGERERILLTKDQNLSREARRRGVDVFIPGGSTTEERLASVAREYGLVLKVYWCGSHWERIVEKVSEASRIAGIVKPENSL